MSMPVISALDFTGESMVDEITPKDSPMKRFYRDKTVFITGGLGFLGQLFVEKLLRCKAKEIYVLARPKKNKSSTERIHETFVGEVFVKLKSMDPNYLARIKLIEGDTSRADLSISHADRKDLIANVEIVIHAAADVRFDKPLQELCFTNVRGTKAVTLLVEEMEKLIVFAFVSTAFSQFYREKIEEKFYPPPCDPDEMIRIAEHFQEHQTDELNILTDKLLRPWENTYVFTKALAEEVVRRSLHKFPTVVIRPSIVISTYEDPIPAWSNNIYGVNGICVGAGLGFIKVSPCSKHSKNNVICADFVTNGTLAAIWGKANEKPSENRNKFDESKSIYHITSQDPLTYGRFTDEVRSVLYKNPSTQSIWVPSLTFVESQLMFYIMIILYHVIPAVALDTFFKLTNNKQRLLPMYRKSQDFLYRVAYFCNHEWNFGHENMKAIIESMCEEDDRFFHCNMFKLNLLEYSYAYMIGLKTYVAKEPPNNERAAKRKLFWLSVAYYPVLMFYYSCLALLIYLFMRVIGLTAYLTVLYGKVIPLMSFYGTSKLN